MSIMKEIIVEKNLVDPLILNNINRDLMNELKIFLSTESKLGGQKFGHLNATIGNQANLLLDQITENGLFEKIESEYNIDLKDYFLTCACNINLPGSKKQHIHRDTNFDDSKIIINIPLVEVNEDNGSIEVYQGSNEKALSFLDFVLNKRKYTRMRINTHLGDVFVRDSNLFHRGMSNSSSIPRSMVAITLSRKDSALPGEIDAVFGGGKIEFMNNWFENNLFGRISESVYMYFPLVRSLKRVIASLLKEKNLST